MHVLGQFGQPRDYIDQVIAKADWVRGGETQTFETIDCTNRFEQLHERALRVAAVIDRPYRTGIVTPPHIYTFAPKRHIPDPPGPARADLRDAFRKGTAWPRTRALRGAT